MPPKSAELRPRRERASTPPEDRAVSSVDVIVPCYRYGHFLRECVESVLRQTGVNVRVLIIDDASPDNTTEVATALVREDPGVIFVGHATNKGHIDTYNEGIDWASADYMLLLSADDYLLPGALSRAADLMDAHPEVAFTFGNFVELSDGGAKTPIRSAVDPADGSDRRILKGLEFIASSEASNRLATCTAVVRTKLQKRLGGYRRELPHSGDMEMWLRFAAYGSVGFVSAYQGVYRRHRDNMSWRFYLANGGLPDFQQRKAAYDSFFETCGDALPNLEQLRQKVYRSLGARVVGLASDAFNEGELAACSQLAEFALSVYPPIKRSLGWMKLTCKRRLGPRAWSTLRPAGLRGVPD